MTDQARIMNMFRLSMNSMNNVRQTTTDQVPPHQETTTEQNKRTFDNACCSTPPTTVVSPMMGGCGATKKRRINGVSMNSVTVPLGKSWWRYGEIQKDLIQSIIQQEGEPSHPYQSSADQRSAPVVQRDNIPNSFSRIVSVDSLPEPAVARTTMPTFFSNASFPSVVTPSQATSSATLSSTNPGLSNPFFHQQETQSLTQVADIAKNVVDNDDDDDCSDDGSSLKFRAYQAENWTEKFEELIEFRNHFGHCLVPNAFPENHALAQWVKRQRYQYKLKLEGKRSTMSDERVAALEEIGFVWDSHGAIWDERFHELLDYKAVNGDCNVPSRYADNKQLAVWVKRQRRQYKFYCESQPSSMTEERISRLNSIGFEWDLRQKK